MLAPGQGSRGPGQGRRAQNFPRATATNRPLHGKLAENVLTGIKLLLESESRRLNFQGMTGLGELGRAQPGPRPGRSVPQPAPIRGACALPSLWGSAPWAPSSQCPPGVAPGRPKAAPRGPSRPPRSAAQCALVVCGRCTPEPPKSGGPGGAGAETSTPAELPSGTDFLKGERDINQEIKKKIVSAHFQNPRCALWGPFHFNQIRGNLSSQRRGRWNNKSQAPLTACSALSTAVTFLSLWF